MLRKLSGIFRDFGPAAGAAYLLDRLLRAVSPRLALYVHEVMVQPIGGVRLLPERMTRNLRFESIGPQHPDLQRLPVPDAVKTARFAQGARCLAIYRKETFIGYVWFAFGRYDEDEVRCTYDLSAVERAAWDFDLYLFPEHRMGTGFLSIWHAAFEHLAQAGVEQSFSRVSRFNLASRRAHARLGSRRVGRLLVVKLGRLEIAVTSTHPFVGLTRSGRLSLTLREPRSAACRPQATGGSGPNAELPVGPQSPV